MFLVSLPFVSLIFIFSWGSSIFLKEQIKLSLQTVDGAPSELLYFESSSSQNRAGAPQGEDQVEMVRTHFSPETVSWSAAHWPLGRLDVMVLVLHQTRYKALKEIWGQKIQERLEERDMKTESLALRLVASVLVCSSFYGWFLMKQTVIVFFSSSFSFSKDERRRPST